MKRHAAFVTSIALIGFLGISAGTSRADDEHRSDCKDLPSHAALAQRARSGAGHRRTAASTSRCGRTVVNRDGVVCAVAFTGNNRGDQWPGSRVISAQKANTANAFSLPGLALSTANLYTAVQPGGSLFGLQASNPVDTDVAYGGNPANYGQRNDPMVGRRIGGVNVFGGGLALYNSDGQARRRDRRQRRLVVRRPQHRVADAQHAGPRLRARRRQRRPTRHDNIVYDITPQAGQMPGMSASGWGHPACSAAMPRRSPGLSRRRSDQMQRARPRTVTTQDSFARVRKVGLALREVEGVTRYDGSPVLKLRGCFMAGMARHRSAEPDTLVVRSTYEDREWLLEDAPDTYYVTDYYRKYPVVLARLARLDRGALRDSAVRVVAPDGREDQARAAANGDRARHSLTTVIQIRQSAIRNPTIDYRLSLSSKLEHVEKISDGRHVLRNIRVWCGWRVREIVPAPSVTGSGTSSAR